MIVISEQIQVFQLSCPLHESLSADELTGVHSRVAISCLLSACSEGIIAAGKFNFYKKAVKRSEGF